MNKQWSKQLQHTPTLLQISSSSPQHISAKTIGDASNAHPQDTALTASTTAALLGRSAPRQEQSSWAWDQCTQQTRLTEVYTAHLCESLGQEPASGLRPTYSHCMLPPTPEASLVGPQEGNSTGRNENQLCVWALPSQDPCAGHKPTGNAAEHSPRHLG